MHDSPRPCSGPPGHRDHQPDGPRRIHHPGSGALAAALLLLFALGGCMGPGAWRDGVPNGAAGASLEAQRAAPGWPRQTIELTGVPFHPQRAYQCGPAALATVLGASGHAVDPDALVEQVWLPGRRGALAVELLAATRRAGRLAYPIDAEFAALLAELQAGRPVLVMQNLGLAWLPAWHFAVVVGFDPERETVILRSGTDARRIAPLMHFLGSWERADRWAMVALAPGELPARVDRDRLLGAAAAVERVDQAGLAHATYRAWLDIAPEDAAARFGLATTATALGDPDTARGAYRALLAQRPDDVRALNNLALLLHEEGDSAVATELLRRALSLTEDVTVRQVLLDSLQTIDPRAEPGAG